MPHRLTPQLFRQLSYFAAIADAGSIRAAARSMGLSVATLSEALAELETNLGVTLAVRSTRSFSLTAEGRRIQAVLTDMLSYSDVLFQNQVVRAELTGEVFITAPVELAQVWLPKKLALFQRECPGILVSVSASDQLLDLANGPFDIALRARHEPLGVRGAVHQELALTCVSASAFGDCAAQDTEMIDIPHPLITDRDMSTIGFWDCTKSMQRILRFQHRMQVDNKSVALAMAVEGLGVALVMRDVARREPRLQMMPEHFDFGHLKLELALRDKRPSPMARALFDFLRSPLGADLPFE